MLSGVPISFIAEPSLAEGLIPIERSTHANEQAEQLQLAACLSIGSSGFHSTLLGVAPVEIPQLEDPVREFPGVMDQWHRGKPLVNRLRRIVPGGEQLRLVL